MNIQFGPATFISVALLGTNRPVLKALSYMFLNPALHTLIPLYWFGSNHNFSFYLDGQSICGHLTLRFKLGPKKVTDS